MAKNDTPEIPGLFDDLPEEAPQEQIAKISLRSWRTHLASIRTLDKRIEKLIDEAVKQALAQGRKLTSADIGLVFQRHPELRAALDKTMQQLNDDLTATIEQGSKDAWLRANTAADAVVAAMANNNAQLAALLNAGTNKPQNDRALRAFQQREMQGLKLSDRVWRATEGMKLDMERAIEVALAEGVPAQKLSERVRELLKEPHRLYRRVRDKDGNLRLSQAAQKYHPGTGVYRSSYKNAMRVARTEVNMAYQASDSERWTRSWWIKGIRVSLSNNHTSPDSKGRPAPLVDICDELAGDYPADFKFTGWHPQCRCFATAITCEYTDIRDYYRRKRAGEDMTGYTPPGTITEPPEQFKRWMADNSDRLSGAAQRGTTPYFIANNAKYTDPNWKPGKAAPAPAPRPKTPLEIADERHARRTADDIRDIQFRWSRRRYNRIDFSKVAPSDVDRYNRLYDMTSFANKNQFNAAEFNTNYSIIMRHARRTPEQKQKIRERWDARYIQQAGETAQLAAMRKVIELQKITSIADVDRIMQEFYAQFPEEFNNVKIKFVSFDRAPKNHTFTMGYSRHDQEIAFNSNKGWGKESPLDTIIKALDKVRTGKKLNLEQHRSIDTIVHELLHQKAGQYVSLKPHGSGDFKRTAMETMNELAARTTAARFLRRIGANTDGVTQLVKNGDGYTTWVRRVLEVCEKAGVNPERLGQEWATTLVTESYDTMDAQLYHFFKTHANKKGFTQTMDEALAIFEDKSSAGKRKWESTLKKWFP